MDADVVEETAKEFQKSDKEVRATELRNQATELRQRAEDTRASIQKFFGDDAAAAADRALKMRYKRLREEENKSKKQDNK